MPMPTLEETYHERAAACRRLAAQLGIGSERQAWLALADQWTKLAATVVAPLPCSPNEYQSQRPGLLPVAAGRLSDLS
jgi:hypothetical protein